jgi:DNA modification methylase
LNKIICGDVFNKLKTLPENSIQTCITSPPYWGLRDYGVSGQIGCEKTIEEYIDKMVSVFREVWRVLKNDGTLWLNLGDSYNNARNGTRDSERWPKQSRNDHRGKKVCTPELKRKDMCGMPWRVALALQADGWWLRQDIIWSKPNPMPESVTDRCTKSHEYLFLLSKSEKYYYDAEAIKEPITCIENRPQGVERHKNYNYNSKYNNTGLMADLNKDIGSGHGTDKEKRNRNRYKTPDGWDTGKGSHGQYHKKGRGNNKNRKTFRGGLYCHHNTYNNSQDVNSKGIGNKINESMKRNKRSVWTIPTQGFKEAHFATFPEKLVEPCIRAGSKDDDIVLDPFGGAGTVGLVALKLNRRYILIELNPEYCKIAEKRIKNEMGLFS